MIIVMRVVIMMLLVVLPHRIMEKTTKVAEEGKEYQPWEPNGKWVWEETACQELPKKPRFAIPNNKLEEY